MFTVYANYSFHRYEYKSATFVKCFKYIICIDCIAEMGRILRTYFREKLAAHENFVPANIKIASSLSSRFCSAKVEYSS